MLIGCITKHKYRKNSQNSDEVWIDWPLFIGCFNYLFFFAEKPSLFFYCKWNFEFVFFNCEWNRIRFRCRRPIHTQIKFIDCFGWRLYPLFIIILFYFLFLCVIFVDTSLNCGILAVNLMRMLVIEKNFKVLQHFFSSFFNFFHKFVFFAWF